MKLTIFAIDKNDIFYTYIYLHILIYTNNVVNVPEMELIFLDS